MTAPAADAAARRRSHAASTRARRRGWGPAGPDNMAVVDSPIGPLTLAATIPIPGAKGRLDHMASDGDRVYLVAHDHGSLQVIDLRTRAVVATVTGVGNDPYGLTILEDEPD